MPYACSVCATVACQVIEQCTTEVEFPFFYDSHNIKHRHDENRGLVTIRCALGHTTTQPYVATCSCGWNSKQKYSNEQKHSTEQNAI